MKLRDPGKKLPDYTPDTISPQKKNKWKTYQIALITPMFGGGVKAREPDVDMPVRASAIRGQLRYWWRFLAKNREDSPLSGKEMFEEEREIWGGMAENNEDFSSKVRLKIENIKEVDPRLYKETEVGYALFPARQQTDENCAKKLIREGMTFDLKICASDDIMGTDVGPALSWWATFGGIGARTRRGVGAIQVQDGDDGIITVTDQEVKSHNCKWKTLPPHDNAKIAWQYCIDILQGFRQMIPIRENGKIVDWVGAGRRTKQITRDNNATTFPSGSHWPEADAIRKTTGKSAAQHKPPTDAHVLFPRALFGLPIIFSFLSPSDRGIPPTTDLLPYIENTNCDRLASPLILKPVATELGKFRPTALLMPYDHFNGIGLQLKYSKQEDIRNYSPSEWLLNSSQLWDTNNVNQVKPIKDNEGQDALTAFLNYFANGGHSHD